MSEKGHKGVKSQEATDDNEKRKTIVIKGYPANVSDKPVVK